MKVTHQQAAVITVSITRLERASALNILNENPETDVLNAGRTQILNKLLSNQFAWRILESVGDEVNAGRGFHRGSKVVAKT